MTVDYYDPLALAVIALALLLGGVVKGATGAGTPVAAVPVIAAFFDVRLAVIIMAAPNLLANVRQIQVFWKTRLGEGFSLRFGLSGAVGAVLGTLLLASLPGETLSLMLAIVVILYIALRFLRSDWRLTEAAARRWVVPAGTVGGMLQGATGISAPVSVSFLNAMRLEREVFIPTVSIFFAAMAILQVPALVATGLLTGELAILSALALIPMLLGLPLGDRLARHLSAQAFDRVLLLLLAVMALRLLWVSLA
ncbi:MAG: sulfite exporter TauE/SafE family protein [Rhodobacteraceae bacterium]|nr:sulfite exporter TauE/SafE family protein [Paracoccaceae bacterium]